MFWQQGWFLNGTLLLGPGHLSLSQAVKTEVVLFFFSCVVVVFTLRVRFYFSLLELH